MKKHFKKLLAIILVASLVFSCSSILASASTTKTYNTVAHAHFETLGGNVPKNVKDSCLYVAASMLLYFYDSYWSDTFVANAYEGEKPHVDGYHDYPGTAAQYLLENDVWDTYENSGGTYSDFIYDFDEEGESNTNKYLHLKLLSMGLSMIDYENGVNSDSYATPIHNLARVLDSYFDSIYGPADYYHADGTTDSSIRLNIRLVCEGDNNATRQTVLDIINDQVSNGNPVIYAGSPDDAQNSQGVNESSSNKNEIGHAMIAYNIDEDGEIYLHTGYTNYNPKKYDDDDDDPNNHWPKISNTKYSQNIEVLWIDINEDLFPHSCTDNYLFYSSRYENGIGEVCSCLAYSKLHPSHNHSLATGNSTCKASTAKTDTCSSCEREINVHDYTILNFSDTHHWYECLCGDKKNMFTHDIEYTHTGETHSVSCECGYIVNDLPHKLGACLSYSASLHKSTCDCGYYVAETHVLVRLNLKLYGCAFCNYTRRITDEEMVHLGIDEETEGDLS